MTTAIASLEGAPPRVHPEPYYREACAAIRFWENEIDMAHDALTIVKPHARFVYEERLALARARRACAIERAIGYASLEHGKYADEA